MSEHLFEVNISLYVVASNEEDAKYVAMRANDPDTVDIAVNEATSVDYRWVDDFPFGGDGVKTCKEYLKP